MFKRETRFYIMPRNNIIVFTREIQNWILWYQHFLCIIFLCGGIIMLQLLKLVVTKSSLAYFYPENWINLPPLLIFFFLYTRVGRSTNSCRYSWAGCIWGGEGVQGGQTFFRFYNFFTNFLQSTRRYKIYNSTGFLETNCRFYNSITF